MQLENKSLLSVNHGVPALKHYECIFIRCIADVQDETLVPNNSLEGGGGGG